MVTILTIESNQNNKLDFILTVTNPLIISCWAAYIANLILFYFIFKLFFQFSLMISKITDENSYPLGSFV